MWSRRGVCRDRGRRQPVALSANWRCCVGVLADRGSWVRCGPPPLPQTCRAEGAGRGRGRPIKIGDNKASMPIGRPHPDQGRDCGDLHHVGDVPQTRTRLEGQLGYRPYGESASPRPSTLSEPGILYIARPHRWMVRQSHRRIKLQKRRRHCQINCIEQNESERDARSDCRDAFRHWSPPRLGRSQLDRETRWRKVKVLCTAAWHAEETLGGQAM